MKYQEWDITPPDKAIETFCRSLIVICLSHLQSWRRNAILCKFFHHPIIWWWYILDTSKQFWLDFKTVSSLDILHHYCLYLSQDNLFCLYGNFPGSLKLSVYLVLILLVSAIGHVQSKINTLVAEEAKSFSCFLPLLLVTKFITW